MKTTLFPRLAVVAALAVAGSSCKKAAELLTFPISDSTTVSLPAVPFFGNITFPMPPFTVKSKAAATYQSYGVAVDHVQNVTLDRLTLTTTNPTTQTFDFVSKINLYIADSVGNNKVLMASLDPVPTGKTSIDLNPTTAKMDAYLASPSYQLITELTQAQALPQATDIRIDSRFKVTAKP